MHIVSVKNRHNKATTCGLTAKRLVTCQMALAIAFSLGSMSEVQAAKSSLEKAAPVVHTINLHNNDDYAKRAAPKEVPPVVNGDVEYVVVHWASDSGAPHNGGYIEARDKKTGKKLWGVQVYTTVYDKNLESDVQDVFITELIFHPAFNALMVKDEAGRTFCVSITTQKVIELKKNK